MRVLHVASGDAWGGAETVVSVLLKGLRDTRVVECEALLLNEGQLLERLRHAAIPTHVVPEQGRSFSQLGRDLRERILSGRWDLIHTHRYKEMALAAVRIPEIPQVVTVHGLEPWRQLTGGQFVRIWGSLLAARARRARFVAVSDELAGRLARVFGAAHVERIPNPMPLPQDPGANVLDLRKHAGWPADRPVVGFVGRLEPVKGPDQLLRVAAGTDPSIGFAFVGSGSMRASLESEARSMGLVDRVLFAGEQPAAAALLPQFDALALPSRHEGTPMVLLEAAACGLPVVAFDVGGVSDIADGGPAARLLPDGDIPGFRDALTSMLVDRETIRDHARAWGASVHSRFSIDTVAQLYVDAYRRALGAEGA